MADWPAPHARDVAVFSRIRLFVYHLPANFTMAVYKEFAIRMRDAYGRQGRCLIRNCLLGMGGAGDNMRPYSSEVPVVMRMLQACTLVTDPAQADAFLVPFPTGLWLVAGWVFRRPPEQQGLLRELPYHLPHLNATTADRHIFLNAVDSCHIAVGTTVPHVHRSIVLHLGDDKSNRSHAKVPSRNGVHHRGVRYNRSVVLPYRAALPSTPAPPPHEPRPMLLFGALDVHRHPRRATLLQTLSTQAAASPELAGRVHLGTLRNVSSLAEASSWAERATFCLCASGDTPSLTHRLYFALLRGCIPVWVDLYYRTPAEEPAFPFPSLIDWDRAVIQLRPEWHHGHAARQPPKDEFDTRLDGLLQRLVTLERREATERRAYIRSIAHWLVYDGHTPDGKLPAPDAASATLHEIALLLGVPASLGNLSSHVST